MASDSSPSRLAPPEKFDDLHLPSHESVTNPFIFQNIPPQPPSPQNSQSHDNIGINSTLENNDFLFTNQPGNQHFITSNFDLDHQDLLENNDFLLNNQHRNQRLANNFDLDHQDLHERYMNLLNAHMQLLAINGATNQHMLGGFVNNDYGGRMLMRPSNPLRHRNCSFISLQDLRGKVISVARNSLGCKFLMRKLDEGNPQEIEFILSAVKGHLHDLMMNEYGSDLVQKIFEAVSEVQMDIIVNLITGDGDKFMDVCINNHGSKAVQKLVVHLTTLKQLVDFTNALKLITVALAKSYKGGNVIQKCLEVSPNFFSSIIWNEIAINCVEIATDKSGCIVLQNCLSIAKGGPILLVLAIVDAALVLSQDPIGNYAVQYLIIKMQKGWINAAIAQQLRGKYVELSTDKFASHVVEILIGHCDQNDAALIILEIMNSPSFLDIVLNPYGNYVVQSALKNSESMIFVRNTLLSKILLNYEYLCISPYGKRVLASAKARKFGPHIL